MFFDVLFYAFSSVENIKILCFIKIIDVGAFKDLFDLVSVQFEANSQLEEIFYSTKIESIEIPQHVTEIGNNSFHGSLEQIIEIHLDDIWCIVL